MGPRYFLQLILIKEYSCDIDAFFPLTEKYLRSFPYVKEKKTIFATLNKRI